MFACQRFYHYLYGRDLITAETDQKPLIPIFSKPLLNAPKRLLSKLLAPLSYNLQVADTTTHRQEHAAAGCEGSHFEWLARCSGRN